MRNCQISESPYAGCYLHVCCAVCPGTEKEIINLTNELSKAIIFVTKGGRIPTYEVRCYIIQKTINQYPGITTTYLMKLTKIPKSPFYRYINKMVNEERVIEKIGNKLYPIRKPKPLSIKKGAHGMIIKFYRQLGRTVLQGLCDHLNTTELFNHGYDRVANLTAGKAKKDSARCITISCSESPFSAEEILELRKEIWIYTKNVLGKKCRFGFSRVEINKDQETTIKLECGEKLPVKCITVTRLNRILKRGYMKKRKNSDKIDFRTESIENGSFNDIYYYMLQEANKEELNREILGYKRKYEAARDERNKKASKIAKLKKEIKNLKNNN